MFLWLLMVVLMFGRLGRKGFFGFVTASMPVVLCVSGVVGGSGVLVAGLMSVLGVRLVGVMIDESKAGVHLALGGNYAKVQSLEVGLAQYGGGTRSEIYGFSRASRRRLLDLVNQLDRRKIDRRCMLFVTLTYPGQWEKDWSVWKGHLRAMIERLKRRFAGVSMIWRLEFQRRGAPHFHILVFGVEAIDIAWLSEAWYDIVGSGDQRHLRAGTQVARVRSWRMLLAYVGKYLGKEEYTSFGAIPTGRIWGAVGRVYLPLVLLFVPFDDLGVFYQVRRVLRRLLEKKLGRKVRYGRRVGQGIKVYVPFADVLRLVGAVSG